MPFIRSRYNCKQIRVKSFEYTNFIERNGKQPQTKPIKNGGGAQNIKK